MSINRCLVISVKMPISYWILTITKTVLILYTNHLKEFLKDRAYCVINGTIFPPTNMLECTHTSELCSLKSKPYSQHSWTSYAILIKFNLTCKKSIFVFSYEILFLFLLYLLLIPISLGSFLFILLRVSPTPLAMIWIGSMMVHFGEKLKSENWDMSLRKSQV